MSSGASLRRKELFSRSALDNNVGIPNQTGALTQLQPEWPSQPCLGANKDLEPNQKPALEFVRRLECGKRRSTTSPSCSITTRHCRLLPQYGHAWSVTHQDKDLLKCAEHQAHAHSQAPQGRGESLRIKEAQRRLHDNRQYLTVRRQTYNQDVLG